MALLEIPVRSDVPAYEYEIFLEGQAYRISIEYNRRMLLWLMAIKDQAGNTILGNCPLVVDWPIIDRFSSTLLPPGRFFVYDSTGNQTDPGEADLGTTHFLFYDESNQSDEVA